MIGEIPINAINSKFRAPSPNANDGEIHNDIIQINNKDIATELGMLLIFIDCIVYSLS